MIQKHVYGSSSDMAYGCFRFSFLRSPPCKGFHRNSVHQSGFHYRSGVSAFLPGKFVGAMSGQHWSFCAAAVETNEKEKNMNLNVTEEEGECEYAITHEFLVRASWSWIVVFLLPAPTGLMSVLSFRVPFLREGDALVIDKCDFHADS